MSNIALVDLSGIFRALWHVNEQNEVNEARRQTVNVIRKYVGDYDGFGICIDMPPYKRMEIDAEYKQHREKAQAVMHEELRECIDDLCAEGYHILGVNGYEADDIIATCVEWSESQSHQCTVFSADKDLLQLVSPNTSVISTATWQKYGPEEVAAKFGVGPELVHDLLALTGDKSDNVQGVPGCGLKTAVKWLKAHGSLEGVLIHADELKGSYKGIEFAKYVSENKDSIGKSYNLTQLMTDAEIKPEIIMTKHQAKKMKTENYEEVETDTGEQACDTVPTVVIEQPETTAVVSRPMQTWDKSLEPVDFRQAWGVSKMLHQSRLFGAFPNAEAIMAIVMTGRSFGMGAVESLRGFHLIKGKVAPSSQLLIGLVKRHGLCEYFRFVNGDSKSATWETKRKGEPKPTSMTYTIDDAKLAGLTFQKPDKEPNQWHKRPQTMLRWRAGVELARLVYPDVVSGLYTDDEVEEF